MYLTQLDTSTLSNQNISSALLIHTFTNTTRLRKIFIDVFATQLAGNGDYIVYATRQRAGAGAEYEVGARTTVAVPSGVTSQMFPTIALTCGATDVIKVYLDGLAGDTTTPDIITDVSEEFVLTDSSGNVTFSNTSIATVTTATNVTTVNGLAAGVITAAAIATDAIDNDALAANAVTEIQSGLATASALTTVGTNVDAILLDTGTDGVVVASGSKTGYSLAAGQLFVKKNTALAAFMFPMFDSDDGTPATGLTVTATRAIDGGAFAACANSVTEVSNGWYKIDLAAADLNGTVIAFKLTATGAASNNFSIVTQA